MRSKEKRIAQQIKNNPKLFYQYINNKIKPKENVSSLLKEDGKLTTNDLEKSEVLNDFFGSVFTVEDKSDIPDFIPNKPINSFVNTVPSLISTQRIWVIPFDCFIDNMGFILKTVDTL